MSIDPALIAKDAGFDPTQYLIEADQHRHTYFWGSVATLEFGDEAGKSEVFQTVRLLLCASPVFLNTRSARGNFIATLLSCLVPTDFIEENWHNGGWDCLPKDNRDLQDVRQINDFLENPAHHNLWIIFHY